MKFSCVMFHLFFHVVQVLSHATSCSGHIIYVFGSILYCLAQYPNYITLLVIYPKDTATTDINVFRNLTNFCNVNGQKMLLLKPSMTSSCYSQKVSIEILFVCKNGNDFMIEVMMGWILIITWRFIPNNSKKCIMKYQNSISKNTLNLVLCVSSVMWTSIKPTNKFTNSGSIFISPRVGGLSP